MSTSYRTWASINKAALVHNVGRVRQQSNAAIMAVVKANAYGHGIELVAPTLAPLVESFAVATFEESIKLRKIVPELPISCLSGFIDPSQLESLEANCISPVIFNTTQIDWIESKGGYDSPLWLKIDTGFGRLGIMPESLPKALSRLQAMDCDVYLMSHFASADNSASAQNNEQQLSFSKAINTYNHTQSFANSAAVLTRPQDHYDVVRPGLMLYGASPLVEQDAKILNLKAVMHLHARVLDIKKLKVGDRVGYGAKWQAKHACQLGIISIGYGDGYPRVISDQASVYIHAQRYKIIGRISMDTLAVNLGDATAVNIGDQVELWGENILVDEVAQWANTISYELMCRLAPRVVRVLV